MRRAFIASVLASAASGTMAAALEYANRLTTRYRINFDRVGPKRRNQTSRHRHSCARQRARIQRQVAAGQLMMNVFADGKQIVKHGTKKRRVFFAGMNFTFQEQSQW